VGATVVIVGALSGSMDCWKKGLNEGEIPADNAVAYSREGLPITQMAKSCELLFYSDGNVLIRNGCREIYWLTRSSHGRESHLPPRNALSSPHLPRSSLESFRRATAKA